MDMKRHRQCCFVVLRERMALLGITEVLLTLPARGLWTGKENWVSQNREERGIDIEVMPVPRPVKAFADGHHGNW